MRILTKHLKTVFIMISLKIVCDETILIGIHKCTLLEVLILFLMNRCDEFLETIFRPPKNRITN